MSHTTTKLSDPISNPSLQTPLEQIRAAVVSAAVELTGKGDLHLSGLKLERPPQTKFGDYSTNIAMLLAPIMGDQPRAIAQQLSELITKSFGPELERIEIAGPGFLNLFLNDSWFAARIDELCASGDSFGRITAQSPQRILIEFVSANPTGPLTAAGGRHAAYGDALANILEFAGHSVEREYYVNDFGSQIERLGKSIKARANGEDVPEDGYSGDYVTELAQQIEGAATRSVDELAQLGIEQMVERIKQSLSNFGANFDTWFSERSLHQGENPAADKALTELKSRGHVYESDGALWLQTQQFGDDKDRVLVRASGEPTYFASDIAYHEHKHGRGFDLLINIWGADHHGYVPRMKAAFEALGGSSERLEVVIMQFVNLIEQGQKASMSKRRGDFVTLDELVQQIGVDAARFLMLQRSHDTTVDLDLDLAREQSSQNPVYYVQYAHARICSILERVDRSVAASDSLPPLQQVERDLIKHLIEYPLEVAEAAQRRAPHRIAVYLLELAQSFTAFYRDCKVVGAESKEAEQFRAALCAATAQVLSSGLALLGVSAPREM